MVSLRCGKNGLRFLVMFGTVVLLCIFFSCERKEEPAEMNWPAATRECRPWTYWWWMGSAVDEPNLTKVLEAYRQAGMGGVHIVPIYGVKGCEDRFIDYLSPKWMQMLRFTVAEANQLDMGVDMTTGTGWCFGGPQVSKEDADYIAVMKICKPDANGVINQKFDEGCVQAVMAYSE